MTRIIAGIGLCVGAFFLAACGGSIVTAKLPTAPQIFWTAPEAISYGTALSAAQLNATASVPGSFAYSPALGAQMSAGVQTLSVTFTPTNTQDYATASAHQSLIVNQANPQIAWATPAAIVIGTALSTTQLQATANVPGSFAYFPALGAQMSVAGPQKLTAIFTPDDTANYTSAPASVTLSVLPYGLVAWGDSLTAGNEGIADTGIYPTELQSLTLLPVVNEGVGGNTSTQIGVRQGSVPTYASVAGGLIPASGGVAVSFPTGFEPVTAGGPATGVQGSILGVHGNVTYANGIYTFTPTVTGTPVSAPGSPRLIVDTPYASYLPVFWEGRNNFMHASQVLSDLAAQVATVPAGQNYLVLSVINMDSPLEQKGGYGYNQILALNQQLGSVYGEHYLDVRKILVDSYNPLLITDVSDFNNDEPPTSLRAILDNGSLTNAIGASDTSFAVHLTGYNLATGEILTVDTGANAENVLITALSGNTVTVTRNLGGNNTAHAAGSNVTGTDAVHLNAQGDQIVAHAVANYLAATQPAGQASKP